MYAVYFIRQDKTRLMSLARSQVSVKESSALEDLMHHSPFCHSFFFIRYNHLILRCYSFCINHMLNGGATAVTRVFPTSTPGKSTPIFKVLRIHIPLCGSPGTMAFYLFKLQVVVLFHYLPGPMSRFLGVTPYAHAYRLNR